jgi:hypothetical protein
LLVARVRTAAMVAMVVVRLMRFARSVLLVMRMCVLIAVTVTSRGRVVMRLMLRLVMRSHFDVSDL